MVYKTAGWQRVSTAAAFNPGQEVIAMNPGVNFEHITFNAPIPITNDGYIYVWVSNESENTKVWFDDVTVTHTQNLITQATDYGVWGDVLREQKADEALYNYRYGYQGKYAEKDEETGWNHFELREYDPVIGRWLVPDPMRQYPSPYIAYGNNPVNKVDPRGGCDDPSCFKFEMAPISGFGSDISMVSGPSSHFDLATGTRWMDGIAGAKFLLDWTSEIDLSISSFSAVNSLILEDAKLWSRVTSSYGLSYRYIDRTSDVLRVTAIGSTPLSVRLGNFGGRVAPVIGKLGSVAQGISLAYDTHLYNNNKMTFTRYSYKLGSAGASWYAGYLGGGWVGVLAGIGSYGAEKVYDNFIEPGLWYLSGKSVEFQNAMKSGYPYTNMTNGVWPKK